MIADNRMCREKDNEWGTNMALSLSALKEQSIILFCYIALICFPSQAEKKSHNSGI